MLGDFGCEVDAEHKVRWLAVLLMGVECKVNVV